MNSAKIGQTLKELRGDKTLQEVANTVGISVSALAMYEQGQRIARDEIKLKLAEYYNTTVQAIFYN